MRVIVPFVPGQLRPEVSEALYLYGVPYEPEYVDVSGSDTAYAELLAEVWADGRAFTVIEQDVVVRPKTLDDLEQCGHDYCCFPYALRVYTAPALGCTRFTDRLLRDHSDVMERVLRVPTNYGAPGHWRQLDTVIMRTVLLNGLGLQPHVHLPPVVHLNEEKQLPRDGAPLRMVVPAWPALKEPVCEHDWRIDPRVTLMSQPPAHRLVCTRCSAISSRSFPGEVVLSNDPNEWQKA